MTSNYCDKTQANTHQSRHYESCLNSTCSRSPSPVRRQLWEPKHPPPQKQLKSNNPFPLKPLDTTKQSTNYTKSRDRSPFLPRPCDLTCATTPSRSRDPLFTYTINAGPIECENETKSFELKIQKHSDSSLPALGRKTPELSLSCPPLRDRVATRDSEPSSKLSLKLDTSRVPPIITIKNTRILAKPQQSVQPESSTTSTTCPATSCHYSSSCCTQPYPCSPKQTIGSCDFTCQPCPCPYLNSPRSNSKEDKAVLPIKTFFTPPELEPSSSTSVYQNFPNPNPYFCFSTKEDKALSPIYPLSRPASPCPNQDKSPQSISGHNDHHGSDISSKGSIELEFEEGSKVHVDWEDTVGPTNAGFPLTSSRDQRSRSDDQVHSHNPQVEVVYTSSYNQSGSLFPFKSKRILLSSQVSEGQGSRSPARPIVHCPPSNPCEYNNDGSFNEARMESPMESCCPSRSPCSPSTSYSRSPNSRSLSKKPLSRSNSFGSIEIYSEDGEMITNIDWSSPISNVDIIHNKFSKPERFDCRINDCHFDSPKQPLSPILTVTPPHASANGEMTIEWSPRSADERRYKEIHSLVFKKEPCEGDYGKVQPSYRDNGVSQEARESHPKVVLQAQKHLNPQKVDSEYKSCMQSENLTCTSCCKQDFSFSGCTPNGDICQGTRACCDSCCCCYSNDCLAPIEGLNRCTSLPPHLQSDWSANLRSPQGEMRMKPILYRDTQGYEHIMFADGSIEHLSCRCEPTTSTPSQLLKSPRPPPTTTTTTTTCTFARPCISPPCSPPSYCQRDCQPIFRQEERQEFDKYSANKFSPQCGDIVIRARQRLPCMYPGKDNGQVAFFSSDYLDLQEGDSIARLGKFDHSGQWRSAKLVEMYLRGSHGQWLFLGTTEGHYTLPPLEADRHQVVKTPNKELRLRQGDLVISTIPSPNSFYFWNPKKKVEIDHSHLLLRAYIGHPQVVDEKHNLACCVPGHLPVGYVELYVKVKRVWLFLGRDDHMFIEHELMHFS